MPYFVAKRSRSEFLHLNGTVRHRAISSGSQSSSFTITHPHSAESVNEKRDLQESHLLLCTRKGQCNHAMTSRCTSAWLFEFSSGRDGTPSEYNVCLCLTTINCWKASLMPNKNLLGYSISPLFLCRDRDHLSPFMVMENRLPRGAAFISSGVAPSKRCWVALGSGALLLSHILGAVCIQSGTLPFSRKENFLNLFVQEIPCQLP